MHLEAKRKQCQTPVCVSKKKSKQEKELLAVFFLHEIFLFISLKH